MYKAASSSTLYTNFHPLLSLEGSQTNLNILLGREHTQHIFIAHNYSKYHSEVKRLANKFACWMQRESFIPRLNMPSNEVKGREGFHLCYPVKK